MPVPVTMSVALMMRMAMMMPMAVLMMVGHGKSLITLRCTNVAPEADSQWGNLWLARDG